MMWPCLTFRDGCALRVAWCGDRDFVIMHGGRVPARPVRNAVWWPNGRRLSGQVGLLPRDNSRGEDQREWRRAVAISRAPAVPGSNAFGAVFSFLGWRNGWLLLQGEGLLRTPNGTRRVALGRLST